MSSVYATSYKGEIWVVTQDNQDINVSVLAFNKENRKFSKQKGNRLNIDLVGGDIKVLAFSCIVEASTGLRQPCLLIEQDHSEHSSILHFYFFVNDRTLTKVATFYYNLRISCTSYVMSDGPSISWITNNKINFLRRDFQSASLVYTSHLCTANTNKSLTLLWSGTLEDQLFTVACSKEEIILADATNGCTSSQGIVPKLYSSIVACLCIYNVVNTNNLFTNNESCYKQEVYIGTTKGQLIKFTGGKFMSHWQLPFDDPCTIEIIEADIGFAYAVVQSEENTVCVINLSENKVVIKWPNQDFFFIDDFLENGTRQLCLVQDCIGLQNLIQGYLLATLDGKTIGLNQERFAEKSSLNPSQSSSDCISSTIQALRTRLQASKSHLSELRIEYNDKIQMIDSTCNILHRTIGIGSQEKVIKEHKKNSNLVHLHGDEPSSENWEEKKQDRWPIWKEHEINIKAVWQNVIGSNWIIGVDLKNVDKRNVSDISLSLVSFFKESQKSLCQTLFPVNNSILATVNHDDENLTPSSKRKKLEHSVDYRVALVTTLPSFSKGKNVSSLVALSWTDCHDNSRHILRCGYVHLDVDQLIRGNLGISHGNTSEQRRRDLTALKAISLETKLSISQLPSPFSMLAALCKELDLVPICDVTSESAEEILLSATKTIGINEGVGIVVDSRGHAFKTEILLFTRNLDQVYLSIHKIRDALPDNVSVKLSEKIRINAESHVLRNINNLLVIAKEDTIKALSNKKHVPTQDLTSVDCTDDKIRNIRKAFEEKRTKFCTRILDSYGNK